MRLKFLMMAFVLIAASLSLAAPASAAPGATILSVTFDPATCLLTTVFQVEDAGDYFVTLYDDGVLLAGGGGNFPAGSTQAIYITIGGPDGSPGVAVGVRESLLSPTAFDFLNGEFWTDPEGIDCQERGFVFGQYLPSVALNGCTYPLPDGFVVRNIPLGSPAYFDSRIDTYVFDLPAGTWYAGNPQGEFTQIWIACEADAIWIPTSNIAG